MGFLSSGAQPDFKGESPRHAAIASSRARSSQRKESAPEHRFVTSFCFWRLILLGRCKRASDIFIFRLSPKSRSYARSSNLSGRLLGQNRTSSTASPASTPHDCDGGRRLHRNGSLSLSLDCCRIYSPLSPSADSTVGATRPPDQSEASFSSPDPSSLTRVYVRGEVRDHVAKDRPGPTSA